MKERSIVTTIIETVKNLRKPRDKHVSKNNRITNAFFYGIDDLPANHVSQYNRIHGAYLGEILPKK
jgi:hypothetical protein